MKKKFEINRFLAKTDKGRIHTIVEYQDAASNEGIDSPLYKIAGSISYQTSTGLSVNKIGNDTFQILQNQDLVKKVR